MSDKGLPHNSLVAAQQAFWGRICDERSKHKISWEDGHAMHAAMLSLISVDQMDSNILPPQSIDELRSRLENMFREIGKTHQWNAPAASARVFRKAAEQAIEAASHNGTGREPSNTRTIIGSSR